jgi:hypothetical protein
MGVEAARHHRLPGVCWLDEGLTAVMSVRASVSSQRSVVFVPESLDTADAAPPPPPSDGYILGTPNHFGPDLGVDFDAFMGVVQIGVTDCEIGQADRRRE